MHKAETIRDEIYNLLLPLVTGGKVVEVTKNNTAESDKLPIVRVVLGEDVPSDTSTPNFIDWDLIIYTDYVVRSTNEDLDSITLGIREAVYTAIMQTQQLGLSFVIDVMPGGMQDPDTSSDSDQFSSLTRESWIVKYRTNRANPSV